MDISTFLGNRIVNHLLKNETYTVPTAIYVSAHGSTTATLGDPELTGILEVGLSGSAGYDRKALALDTSTGASTTNSASIEIVMPSNMSALTYVSYLGVWDTKTPGTAASANASTTVASGSNGAAANAATLHVASTTGFPVSGALGIVKSGVLITIYYTGLSGTSFTGCTSTSSTALATGDVVTTNNFLFKVPLVSTPFEAAVLTNDAFYTGVNHGFSTNDRIVILDVGRGALPAATPTLSAASVYYVSPTNLGADYFSLSITPSGSPINVTAGGGLVARKLTVQPFNPSNLLQIPVGALTFAL